MGLLPKKPNSKCATGHVDFNFDTLGENFSQNPEIFGWKSGNRVKTIFFFEKKSFF